MAAAWQRACNVKPDPLGSDWTTRADLAMSPVVTPQARVCFAQRDVRNDGSDLEVPLDKQTFKVRRAEAYRR